MREKSIGLFLLGVMFFSLALADSRMKEPGFSDYVVELYSGRLIIPAYYKKSGDVWRDDLGKEVGSPDINFAGRYHVGVHSCGAECRYYTLSDLSTGRDSKALDMFSSDGEVPPRTKDGRTYITTLLTRSNSAMIVAQYHIDEATDHPPECRERIFVFNNVSEKLTPITATMNGCRNK